MSWLKSSSASWLWGGLSDKKRTPALLMFLFLPSHLVWAKTWHRSAEHRSARAGHLQPVRQDWAGGEEDDQEHYDECTDHDQVDVHFPHSCEF
jgi:hypothetical protein